jgi:hypothetical protein
VKNCSIIEPLPLVRFDGAGLRADGEYCVYYTALNQCNTDTVIYDETGLKSYTTRTARGAYCPTINAVVYDGTGLKVSVESMPCLV